MVIPKTKKNAVIVHLPTTLPRFPKQDDFAIFSRLQQKKSWELYLCTCIKLHNVDNYYNKIIQNY